MNYPDATDAQRDFFREHGWLVVEDAVAPTEVAEIAQRMEIIILRKEKLAFDWAWEKGKSKEARDFKIVQGSPTLVWREIAEQPFRRWALSFAATLLGKPVEFWYDQFLAKPPRDGAPTYWHQDEGYWGRNLDGLGLTCWLPLHEVDETNGCMCFIDRGHRDGILEHFHPEHIQSDLLFCEPDLSRRVACPIRTGSVTFHHGKTPHMTPPNKSESWRRAVTTHMRAAGSPGEGDHFPWKTYVNQLTRETTIPPRR